MQGTLSFCPLGPPTAETLGTCPAPLPTLEAGDRSKGWCADAGMTAIHLATLKGSASALFSLLRHGAAADAQIVGTSITPWLSQGSTALHIAAARGYVGCVTVLLEFQATVPGAAETGGGGRKLGWCSLTACAGLSGWGVCMCSWLKVRRRAGWSLPGRLQVCHEHGSPKP